MLLRSRGSETANALTKSRPDKDLVQSVQVEAEPNHEALEVSSQSSEEQLDLVEVLGEHEQQPRRDPFPQCQDLECVVHKKSGIVHCLRSEQITYCGRHLSQNYVSLTKASIEDMECCILCGRQLAANFE